MNESKHSVREIFAEALEISDPVQRAAFLDRACGADVNLRREVEELLQAEADAGQFLPDQPGPASRSALQELVAAADSLGALSPAALTEQPGDRIGRYKLLQKIGEGGCGVVYMAEQEEPVRRRVALKVIKLGMDTRQVIARFEAERQALAMMDHPNIAKVFDAGATDSDKSEIRNPKSEIASGRPYFVMELVRGIKITDYCSQHQLSTRARLELFIHVCQAVQHAHQKGIIHRDLKPSNILVTVNDGGPVPKVIDFGIAKATEGKLTDQTLFTALEQFLGTPAYMSPEQAAMTTLDIDTRSDIYSLGVLLYELLTGTTPFDTKELLALGVDVMRRTIREKEPVRPSKAVERLSELSELSVERRTEHARQSGTALNSQLKALSTDLDWIVMKALEKDRARRYETANGFAMDIQRHLRNEPVIARPPSAAYRFQKLVRRNKLAFTAATAVAAALVIGLGAATVMFFRERLARNGEQQQRLTAQSAQQQSQRLLYAADMNLAQQTLKMNNLGQARRLLDRHRPRPGEEDLRGWEWRYLWQLTRSSALVTLTNRLTRGGSVSFSPDGTRLAVGWWDGRVELWDVPGRRLLRALTDHEQGNGGWVAFSPVRNLLVANSEPKVVTLYDLDSGGESVLWQAPNQGAWGVRGLSFSPDGSRVVIYAGSTREIGDAVWVVNVSSRTEERRYSIVQESNLHWGAARLSPDNQRLYLGGADSLNSRYSIQCFDAATGNKLWQTEPQRDGGLTTLAISPDGRVLVSGSGYEDPIIRVWDAATGLRLVRLDGHTGWVCNLVFCKDGRHLISAATDQTIRFWDTSNWTETKALRGHTDEVHAVAISESAHLVASTGKDGNLMLWKEDGKSATDGYRRLSEELRLNNQVLTLDHSRVLLLPPGKPPEIVDLKRDSVPVSLPEIGSSTNVLGCFGTNILCHWNGTNQIVVREFRGAELVQRGAIALDSGTRPAGFAYNATRQLMAWTEWSSSNSVYLANLAAPGRRIELKSDVPGLVPFLFSEDGRFLAARGRSSRRVWNVETGHIVASIDGNIGHATFATGARVLVVAIGAPGSNHEIRFYDLAHPDQAPRHIPGRDFPRTLAVSPDGGLVASATGRGEVRFFDPIRGELIESVHGHLNGVADIAFSADGRRLISTMAGREAVKLWDVGTRQELLTLAGTGSYLQAARWSADGDVILAGAPPWQAWRAPSWEEIAAAEAKEK